MSYLLQKKYHVIIILVMLIILSLIYPIKYKYTDKKEMVLPDYHTYKEALFQILPEKIINKARAGGLKDYIAPVKAIEGPDNSMPKLINDINMALIMYDGWKVGLDEDEVKIINARWKEMIEKGQLPSYILKILKEGLREARTKTIYKAKSSWGKKLVSDADNIELSVSILKTLPPSGRVFDVSVTFMEEGLINQLKNNVSAHNNNIKYLKVKSEISKNIFAGFALLFVAFTLLISGDYFYQRIYIQKYQDNLVKDIPKLKELADNGHFVTAIELADKILEQFPDDIETRAYRERVMDFTNNNPKQAQIAYVEAKKLELRLQMFQKNPQDALLHAKEKEGLIPLLPYHPGLQSSYNLLVAKEEERDQKEQNQKEINDVEKLISNGLLERAKEALNLLESNSSNNLDLTDLRFLIQQEDKNALNQLETVIKSLRDGKIKDAKQFLNEFLSKYSDNPEGLDLQNQFSSSGENNKFRLQKKNNSGQIFIYFKDEIIIGRLDENIKLDIEIDDRRISRPHASIEFSSENVNLKDLDSTGGTFINGEKIVTQLLKNNDRITLAKVVDMDVHFPRNFGENGNGFCLVYNKDQYLLAKSNLSFDFTNSLIQLTKSIYSIRHEEGLTILITPTSTYVLRNDIEIVLGNETFTVENVQ